MTNPTRITTRALGRVTLVLVALLLAMSACGDDSTVTGAQPDPEPVDGEDSADPEPAEGPVGDWVMTSGTAGGQPVESVPGYDVTISFAADGTVGGRAACNSFGGTSTFDEDGRLSFGELASTAMGCEPAVMDLESRIFESFAAVTGYQVEGGLLHLTGTDVDLVFEPVPPVPTADLVDTEWVLDTLIDGATASSTLGTATLRLAADGTMTGSTGCRDLTGTWIESGGALQFPTLSADGDCPSDLADQDGFVVTVLEGPARVEIDGVHLTLTSPGEIGLRYRSDPAG